MYVGLFCQHTKCDLPRSDDRSQLKLLSRQVSIHPTYEGAIQVTAVMQNDGLGAQTYPQIRFSLFNVNGDTIASRLFRPDEYLGEQYRPLPFRLNPGIGGRTRLIRYAFRGRQGNG